MSSHGHSGRPAGPSPAEPSFAEQARTLVHLGRSGTLGTLSRRHPGHPFVSVMPYAPDERGRPLVLISGLAMHTQNLDADPRASLLVVQAGHEDPLAMARVTLMGRAERLPAADRAAAAGRPTWRAIRTRCTGWTTATSRSGASTSPTSTSSGGSGPWTGSPSTATRPPGPIRSPTRARGSSST